MQTTHPIPMPLPIASDFLSLHGRAYDANIALSEALEVAIRLSPHLPAQAALELRRRLAGLCNAVADVLSGVGEELSQAARVVGEASEAPF